MNAFFTLLEYDLTLLARSWIVRFWFFLTIVGGVAAVIVAKNFEDTTSFLLGWALIMYMALGSLVVLVNSVSAISLEYRFLGESIISRGIAPTPYVLAKLVSRSLGTIFMFLVIVLPTSFVMMSMAKNNDLTVAGIWVGLGYWTLMLTVLTFFFITLRYVRRHGIIFNCFTFIFRCQVCEDAQGLRSLIVEVVFEELPGGIWF